jgi:hypothetical protein
VENLVGTERDFSRKILQVGGNRKLSGVIFYRLESKGTFWGRFSPAGQGKKTFRQNYLQISEPRNFSREIFSRRAEKENFPAKFSAD